MASLSLSSSNSNNQTPQQKFPPSMFRLWRPQAQRNIRNQWSKLSSLRHQWLSSSSSALAHVSSILNSYLISSKYLDAMDLGVLSDMPDIRKKARCKVLKQQELQRDQLLSSYKSMVSCVIDMMSSSRSMRCFLKATSGSPLTGFSSIPTNSDDTGDGGGAPVSTFLPISAFEMLAEELLQMFKQELLLEVIGLMDISSASVLRSLILNVANHGLQRLIVVELLSVTPQKHEQLNQVSWADELYHGEAEDLRTCNIYSEETAEPCLPKLNGCKSESAHVESDKHPNREILEVYVTTWLVTVNIDTYRMEEIFTTIGEELCIHFK